MSNYTIDNKVYKRFDERQNIFGRMLYDSNAQFYGKSIYENIKKILKGNKKGYSRIDFDRALASWTVYDYFYGAFSWERLKDAKSVTGRPMLKKYTIRNPEKMSKVIKETARMYGANLVGISMLDNKWIYSFDIQGKRIAIPSLYKYAIVMAIRMDSSLIGTSPQFRASLESGLGYSKMAFVVSCTAEFIRNLGYKAIAMGNDTALSIPLAIDAGLGELGRNGLLITPEYGPCVRICKVFTDLPLETDKRRKFGIADFCRKCNLCAEACEVEAIQKEVEPSYRVLCPSNNPGVLKWAVNVDKCFSFWIENGMDCSTCIAVCPLINGNNESEKEFRT